MITFQLFTWIFRMRWITWWIGQLLSVFYLKHNQDRNIFCITSKLWVLRGAKSIKIPRDRIEVS